MKTNWIRFGLPTLSVMVILPACFQQTGGVHGDLYGLFTFIFTLPAQYAMGGLRDAGIVQGRLWECTTVVNFHFISFLIFTLVSITAWNSAKSIKF